MSETTKRFHIGDILTVITGKLLAPRHVDGLYDILNWLTDDNLFTHQLPRASDECAPFLRAQFPDLAAIEVPDSIDSMETLNAWLSTLPGDPYRDVPRLARPEDHAYIDPLLELNHKMVGADKVITVVVDGAE